MQEQQEPGDQARMDTMGDSTDSRTAATVAPESTAGAFDFRAHLSRQREWSGRTFGPGARAKGVVDHIRRELLEIEADPGDLKEWIDVAILALDGAWRSGASPDAIIAALVGKQAKNEAREWPDWRTAPPDKAIEHVKAIDRHTHDWRACSPCGDLDGCHYPGRAVATGLPEAGKAQADVQHGSASASDPNLPRAGKTDPQACHQALIDALKAVDLMFQRQDGDWMGDDEHEAWSAVRAALALAEGRET